MKFLIALFLSFALTLSWAAEEPVDPPATPAPEVPATPEPAQSCPFAVGTFTENMNNRVVHTTETGYWNFNNVNLNETQVSISLRNALLPAWSVSYTHLTLPTKRIV